jgi:hypothetical protein
MFRKMMRYKDMASCFAGVQAAAQTAELHGHKQNAHYVAPAICNVSQ